MKRNRRHGGIAMMFAGALLLTGAAVTSGTTRLRVDPAESRVVIEVGKSGVFGFAGHPHEVVAPAVSGQVGLDGSDWLHSSVSLEFQAPALKVSGAGEPPGDVPEVQRVMLGPKVLDASRYPTVSFRSTRVSVERVEGDGAQLRVEGQLTLHGVTRPVTVPVQVALDGTKGLTGRGVFSLKQSAFGIEPVTAAGGTVRVRDEIRVRFVLAARR